MRAGLLGLFLRPWLADQRVFYRCRTCWCACHAAEGDHGGLHFSIRDGHIERAADRRNVLIEPFGEFVDAQALAQIWDRDACDQLALGAVLFAVGDEEILKRDRTCRCAMAQVQRRPQCDQRRRVVPDGRAVGDIAADGRGPAHLLRSIAADHFGVGRVIVFSV